MDKKYWAFISYSSYDEGVAKWLHRKLETYRIARALAGCSKDSQKVVPKRIYPVFRDRDELKSGPDLGEAIEAALRESQFLIVICSPSAARSEWVNQEILQFQKIGGRNRILCLIVDGEPNISGEQITAHSECYPLALRYVVSDDGALVKERAEPLAADLRKTADGRSDAFLKLVAGIIDVDYEKLRKREQHRRNRLLALVTSISLTIALSLAGLSILAWRSQQEAELQRNLAIKNEASARASEADARHQLGRAYLERAERLDEINHQYEAALLSAKAAGLIANDKAYLKTNDPATLRAKKIARGSRVLRPVWRSAYRDNFVKKSLGFDVNGDLVLQDYMQVKWWNVVTGKPIGIPFVLLNKKVIGSALSEDKTKLALATGSNEGFIFDIESGALVKIPGKIPDLVNARISIAVSSRGDSLAVVSEDGVTVFKTVSKRGFYKLPDLPNLSVNTVRFSLDDKYLVVSGTQRFGIWDLNLKRWRYLDSGVNSFTFLNIDNVLFSRNKTVYGLSVGSAKPIERFKLKHHVTALQTLPNRNEILIAAGGEIQIRSWPDGKQIASKKFSFGPNARWIQSLHVDREGSLVFVKFQQWYDLLGLPSLTSVLKDREEKFSRAGYYNLVTWSPNSKNFATAGIGGVRIWDRHRKPLKSLLSEMRLKDIAYSPNGKLLATCGDSGVEIWDIDLEERIYSDEEEWNCYCLDFSVDGTRLAASKLGGIDVIDVITQKRIRVIELDHESKTNIYPLSFTNDNRYIIGGDLVGNLEIVDVVDGSVEFKFPSQPDSINAISVFGNGRYVLAAGGSLGRDASIYVYDLQEKKKMFSFQNNDPVNALSVNSKLWVLASAHRSGSIKVWDLVNRRLIAVAPGHMRNVRDIEFQSEGLLLASAGYDAALWDTKFLQPLFTQSSPMSKSNESGQVRVMLDLIFGARLSGYGFDFVADGDRVAIGSGEGDIYIKSLWNDNRTITISAHQEETGIVEASPDGKSIVTAGFDGEVYGWDVSSGSKIRTYSRKDKGYVGAVKFSNDGEMLAIGGESGVTVWKSDDEKPLVDINLNQWVTALIFNGQELYFGTKDQFGDSGSLKRWSVKSGDEQVEDILENTPPINTLDRNDNKLAIGYDDGKIQILDLLKNETIGEWSTGGRLQSLVWVSSEKLLTASRQAVSQWTTSGELVSHLKVGRVDHMRWHPGLNVVVTETQGLVRGWYIQDGIPLNMLASEGGFEGMSWRREFKENLAGSPAVYFQTNINQSGNGLH